MNEEFSFRFCLLLLARNFEPQPYALLPAAVREMRNKDRTRESGGNRAHPNKCADKKEKFFLYAMLRGQRAKENPRKRLLRKLKDTRVSRTFQTSFLPLDGTALGRLRCEQKGVITLVTDLDKNRGLRTKPRQKRRYRYFGRSFLGVLLIS